MYQYLVRLPLFLALLLAACTLEAEPAPPCSQELTTLCAPPTISGEVIAPAGGDVADTSVRACPLVGGDAIACGYGDDATIRITQSGPSAPYILEVPAGEAYAVMAEQDVDGDGEPEAGAFVSTPSPARDVAIQLEPY